jgi:hypothetical protein
MFRIYYDINVRSSRKELYFPQSINKVYNYIKCNNIDINNVELNKIYSVNGVDQIVHKIDNTGLFIAPGIFIANPLEKDNYSIVINDTTYSLSFNPYDDIDQLLVGSVVFADRVGSCRAGDTLRLIEDADTLALLNYVTITDVENLFGIYLHEAPTTVAYFDHSLPVLDWLNKCNNLYGQSLSTPKKDVNIFLYYRIYGGIPHMKRSADNTYDFILQNLTTNEEISLKAKQFGYQQINLKHRYRLKITDAMGDIPLMINDTANSAEYIELDLTNPSMYIPIETLSEGNTKLRPLSEIW